MTQTFLAPVLCAHFPPLDLAAPDPALERELFEAAAFSWLPLIDLIDTLDDDGVDAPWTLAVSPSLMALLDDGDLRQRLSDWMARCDHPSGAIFERCGGDILGAWRRCAEGGLLELIPALSTGAILPLLATEACQTAHVRAALRAFESRFGFTPEGAWLPECAFAPGLDGILSRAGVRYTVVTSAAIERASARAVLGHWAPLLSPSGLAFFGRDPAPIEAEGDPGDPSWRPFGNDPEDSPSRAAPGDAEAAREAGRAYVQRRLDAGSVALSARASAFSDAERPASSVLAWRAEAFGVRWAGGLGFFDGLLRAAAKQGVLTTPGRLLLSHPRMQVAVPGISSWGTGGFFADWMEPSTDFLYRHTRRLERWLVARTASAGGLTERDRAELASGGLTEIAEGAPLVGPGRRAALFAVRELLLAQSGDWLVYIHRGANAQYGIERAKGHLDRAGQLVGQIAERRPDRRLIDTLGNTHPAVAAADLGALGPDDPRDHGRG